MSALVAVRSVERPLESALRWLYPDCCEECGVGEGGLALDGRLCLECRQRLLETAASRCCRACGAAIGPHQDDQQGCDLCVDEHFAFRSAIRLGRYEGALAKACLKVKHWRFCRLLVALADLLAEERAAEFAQAEIDLVVPIPSHWSRRWRRGHAPTALLARRLAMRLNKPITFRWLRQVKRTQVQHHLPPSLRRRNMRDAFRAAKKDVRAGSRVLLVDDIMTTGATAHQASKALRQAGALDIVVAVLGRGDHRPGHPPSSRAPAPAPWS